MSQPNPNREYGDFDVKAFTVETNFKAGQVFIGTGRTEDNAYPYALTLYQSHTPGDWDESQLTFVEFEGTPDPGSMVEIASKIVGATIEVADQRFLSDTEKLALFTELYELFNKYRQSQE